MTGCRCSTAPSGAVLAITLGARRVFVTFDCKTIPPLLRALAESGQHHGGVILIRRRTLRSSDVGGLIRVLEMLDSRRGSEDWEDRVIFLGARTG